MRFLLDQSAEARIGAFLTGEGHDATRVSRDHPLGLTDEQLQAILDAGEPAPLPEAALAALNTRRLAATRIGPWVEGHDRPGKSIV